MRRAKILMLECFVQAQAYPEVRRAFSEVAGAQERRRLVQIAGKNRSD
jgi:hypothetical protein